MAQTYLRSFGTLVSSLPDLQFAIFN